SEVRVSEQQRKVTEQILNEYKIRALACHPDKQLENPSAVADFQKLQEAKEVLCNETKRKNYDLWKRSGVTISFHDWQALNDSVKTSMHWAVRDKKEPMLEASKAEILVTCQTEDLYSEQGAPGDSSCGAMPSSSDYCYRRFRWAADSPSSLLQKFRNYEI
uniref:J domain-containing protein n=1 Tax=Anabas testudineus TaxID=64144 RepID=A0AAQ6IFK3_ANATE